MLDLARQTLFDLQGITSIALEVQLNKSELVDRVREEAGLDRRQAEAAVDAVVGAVMATAKAGDKVSIFGFGTFTPTSRAARTGRNPRTGEAVKIAASKGVRFAPAAAFKTALNTKGGAKAAPAKKASASKTTAKKAPAKKAAKSAKKR